MARDTDSQFGALLRKYRKDSKLSQSKLVKRLGMQGYDNYDKSSISKWENNHTKPPSDVVEALEDIFGVRHGLLLKVAGYFAEAQVRGEEPVEGEETSESTKAKQGVVKPTAELMEDDHEPSLTTSKETESNQVFTEEQKKHLDDLRECLSEWDKQSQFVSLSQLAAMSLPDKPDEITRQLLDRVASGRGFSAVYLESFKFHAQGGLSPMSTLLSVEHDQQYSLLQEHLKETDIPALAVQEKERFWKYAERMADLRNSSERYWVSDESFKSVAGEQTVVMALQQMIIGYCLVTSLLCRGLLALPQDNFWLDDCSALASSASRLDALLLTYGSDPSSIVLPSATSFSTLIDAIWQAPNDKTGLVGKTKETIEHVVLYRETHEKLKSGLSSLMRLPRLPGSCAQCPSNKFQT